MIQTYTFHSEKPGKKILLTGRIHGNEPCGEIALNKIKDELSSTLLLQQGCVTIIPQCNPLASSKNVRQIDKNLNRVIGKKANPQTYEESIANILAEYIEKCDILVDLHSGSNPSAYFVFEDYNDIATQELAQASGIKQIVSGWPDLFGETEDSDTVSYAHLFGKTGIVIEGGEHDDPLAPERCYNAVKKILKHYNILQNDNLNTSSSEFERIKMTQIVYKNSDGSFSRQFDHGELVKKGTCIAQFDNGEKIIVQKDCYIILPNQDALIGTERFYLGEQVF